MVNHLEGDRTLMQPLIGLLKTPQQYAVGDVVKLNICFIFPLKRDFAEQDMFMQILLRLCARASARGHWPVGCLTQFLSNYLG